MGAVTQTSEFPSLLFPVFQTKGFFPRNMTFAKNGNHKNCCLHQEFRGTDSKSPSCQDREEKKFEAQGYLSGEVWVSVGRVHHKEHNSNTGFPAASKDHRVPQNRAFLCLLLLLHTKV